MSNSSDSTSQADKLRTKIAKDLIALPVGDNKPLAWDVEVLIDYVAQAQQQLLRELIEQLPKHKSEPIEGYHFQWYNGWNASIKESKALLNKKLQAYGGDSNG